MSPNRVIRPLVAADRGGVFRILENAGNFTPEEVATALELIDEWLELGEHSGYLTYVLESQGEESAEVLGYVSFGPTPLTESTYDLYWIAVDKSKHRGGVGKKLLKFTEDEIVRRGGQMLLIETSSQETYGGTIQFYERTGYELVGKIKEYYKPGDDKLIFAKRPDNLHDNAILAVAVSERLPDRKRAHFREPCRCPTADASASKGQADPSTMDLEQLMKIEIVVAGSKRAQQSRDVASFVSVVTAAEIREHGYRTLADVLRTLPGFYVSNDRNYSYIGVRGFSRPGDWNSRILLLLNGLRTNENVYDLAYIGEEFSVDVDLIERVEVIRGPSSALYGSNAFFAVINVVTRPGSSLAGAEIATSAASFGTYSGRASYGRTFANDLDLLVSATYSDGRGRNLFYPEFDAPLTNNGIANGVDHEGFHKILVTASKGDFSFQANTVSREKGLPTGSYATIFNDKRTRTTDGLSLASLSFDRAFSDGASFSTRLHAGRYAYDGEYAYYPDLPPNKDLAVGEWVGLDVDAARKIGSRQFLTFGAEFRDNFKQFMTNFDPEPYVLYSDVRNKSTRGGVFAQDEIKLADPLMLYAGAASRPLRGVRLRHESSRRPDLHPNPDDHIQASRRPSVPGAQRVRAPLRERFSTRRIHCSSRSTSRRSS